MTDPNIDPLQQYGAQREKTKAVSWKYTRVGQTRVFRTLGLSDTAQRLVFGTNEPDFWPIKPGQEQADPKMAVVFRVFDEEEQEERTLWCPIPSSLLTAVAAAQTEAGVRINEGGTLEITFTGEKPSDKGAPQKLYSAKYTPPIPVDPLAAATAQPAAPRPAAARPPVDDSPPF